MSRTDDIAHLAERIRRDLADGAWHHAVGLGGWVHDIGLYGDALNHLLDAGAIEYDTRRRVYRLTAKRPVRQLNIYDKETA